MQSAAAQDMDDETFGSDEDSELWERPPVEDEPPPVEEKVEPVELTPPDGRRIQIGVSALYGLAATKPALGANPYGLGFGLRGGYTFDFGLFAGLAATYYLGDTVEAGSATGPVPAGGAVSVLSIGLEGGYDLWFDSFCLRPSAELGVITTFASEDKTLGSGRTEGSPFFAPGISLLYAFAEMWYVGGDFRIPISFGNADSTMTFMLQGGVRLE